jgi:hypothetical protein
MGGERGRAHSPGARSRHALISARRRHPAACARLPHACRSLHCSLCPRARARLTSAQVLLVGKDEQQTLAHLAVADDAVQLLPRLVDALAVLRVDDEDEALRARVVVPPERTNLVLPSDVLRQRV